MIELDGYIKKSFQVVYKLGDITYLPHYLNREVFVSPGFGSHHRNIYTVDDLIHAGAKQDLMYLWERPTSLRMRNIL